MATDTTPDEPEDAKGLGAGEGRPGRSVGSVETKTERILTDTARLARLIAESKPRDRAEQGTDTV